MLAAMRNRAGGWLTKAFLGLIALSFAVWGIGDIFRGQGTDVVATVGDTNIMSQDLDRAFRLEVERLQPVFGGRLNTQQARQLGVLDRALERLVQIRLFDIEATRLGLAVGDAAIAARIKSQAGFHNEFGSFDPLRFEQILRASGLDEQRYVAGLRQEMARTQLAVAIGAGAVPPRRLVGDAYRFREERRIAQTLYFPNARASGVGQPDEAGLVEFHKEHADLFTAPEYRKLTYVVLDPDDMAAEIEVSESDLRTAYDDRIAEFRSAERRDVAQILFADETTAGRAREALRQGRDFAAVAAEFGSKRGAAATGSVDQLGWVMRADLALPGLADGVFGQTAGGISDPVKSPLGWHILKVKKIEAARTRSFTEMRETLRKDIAREAAADGLFDLSNRLEDDLAGGGTLEEAGARLNLKVIKIAATDAEGNNESGAKIEGLPKNESFLSVAFDTEQGDVSPVTETEAGGYFLLRVDGVTPPALRPLEQLRARVTEAWRETRRDTITKARAERARERIESGEEPAKVAADMDATYRQTQAFTRTGGGLDPEVPTEVVAPVFTLGKTGEVAVAGGAEGYAVARLIEIKRADLPGAGDQMRTRITESLQQALAEDFMVQFAAALRRRVGVEINQDALEAVF